MRRFIQLIQGLTFVCGGHRWVDGWEHWQFGFIDVLLGELSRLGPVHTFTKRRQGLRRVRVPERQMRNKRGQQTFDLFSLELQQIIISRLVDLPFSDKFTSVVSLLLLWTRFFKCVVLPPQKVQNSKIFSLLTKMIQEVRNVLIQEAKTKEFTYFLLKKLTRNI